MRALLLSAGYGTRLRPLTNSIPKCLVPILGRPLLEYWLEMLFEAGITDFIINVHHLPELVKKYVEYSPYGKYIKLVYEEYLLGTGGTLLKNKNYFKDDQIIFVHTDNLSKFNVTSFINAHHNRPVAAQFTMMTFHSENPESAGIVQTDKDGIVREFFEKVKNPPGNIANAAVYILEPDIFEFLENQKKEIIDFSIEVIPHYLGRIYTFHNSVYHRDIGSIDNYAIAQIEYMNHTNKHIWYSNISGNLGL